ncbi:hypothetical protein EJF36_04960 [Bacillus sp. HMF5848]|uniref:hypothetical protein n=1 Tax=Bacillus sp. HMF5848 TaxID=2495421 RepID=UPI000F772799|nr:hypothetical protein [Bacillus sp. HMF5848]RSK26258.1 hypothetical protein EJF36_04960 [Bacillus sp. HMF5848]
MSEERDKMLRINRQAKEILQSMLRDGKEYDEYLLKNAVEQLARSVVDLSNIQLGLDSDPPTTLKATVVKLQIAQNSVEFSQPKQLA